MLAEGDTRFFGGPSGVGIQSQEKILDLALHLCLTPNGIAWLDLTDHFRLHSQLSPSNPGLSFQAATHHLLLQHWGRG